MKKAVLLVLFLVTLCSLSMAADDSVKVYSYGSVSYLGFNLPEPIEDNVHTFQCKDNLDKPCVLYEGKIKFLGNYIPEEQASKIKYHFASVEQHAANLKTFSAYPMLVNVIDQTSVRGVLKPEDYILDTAAKKVYSIEGTMKRISVVDANILIDNNAERKLEIAKALENDEEFKEQSEADLQGAASKWGEIISITGISNKDDDIPVQIIGTIQIPLKLGEAITFNGLDGKSDYDVDKPVLSITANALPKGASMEDWWSGKGSYEGVENYKDLRVKYQDAEGLRSSKTLCEQTFVNYAPGSAFMMGSERVGTETKCRILKYKLTTMLFEEDDAEEGKGFSYSCGDIDYWAIGGGEEFDTRTSNIRHLYCDQEEPAKARLYCYETDNWCREGTQIKFKINDGSRDYFLTVNKLAGGRAGNFEEAQAGSLKIKATEVWIYNDLMINPYKAINTFEFKVGQSPLKADIPQGTIIRRHTESGQIIIHRLTGVPYTIELGNVWGGKYSPIRALYPQNYNINSDQNYIDAGDAKTEISRLVFNSQRSIIPHFGVASYPVGNFREGGKIDVTFKPFTVTQKKRMLQARTSAECSHIDVQEGQFIQDVLAKACLMKESGPLTSDELRKADTIYEEIKSLSENAGYFSSAPDFDFVSPEPLLKNKILKTGKVCIKISSTQMAGDKTVTITPLMSCKSLMQSNILSKMKDEKVSLGPEESCPSNYTSYIVQNGDTPEKISSKCGILNERGDYTRFLQELRQYNIELYNKYIQWDGDAETFTKSVVPVGSKICMSRGIRCTAPQREQVKKVEAREKLKELAEQNNRVIPERLRVNVGRNYYQMEKGRSAGESDLMMLTNVANSEESWIYVKYSDGKSVWQENGRDETALNVVSDMTPMIEIVKRENEIQEITFYHFHPNEKVSPMVSSETPSKTDFEGYALIFKLIKDNKPSLLDKLDFRVVVSTGVYTVKINRNFIDDETLLDKGLKMIDELGMERAKIASPGGISLFDYSQGNRAQFSSLNQRFANEFSNEAIQITFKPGSPLLGL